MDRTRMSVAPNDRLKPAMRTVLAATARFVRGLVVFAVAAWSSFVICCIGFYALTSLYTGRADVGAITLVALIMAGVFGLPVSLFVGLRVAVRDQQSMGWPARSDDDPPEEQLVRLPRIVARVESVTSGVACGASLYVLVYLILYQGGPDDAEVAHRFGVSYLTPVAAILTAVYVESRTHRLLRREQEIARRPAQRDPAPPWL
jgi:hypothetical protein